MDITISSSLTPREKDKIFLLLDACYKKEPVSLTFPTEEADHYLLAWENGRLLCAAALLEEDETVYECTAFTRPDCRRNGIFGAVLEKGLSLLPEDTELLFYVDKKSPDALELSLIHICTGSRAAFPAPFPAGSPPRPDFRSSSHTGPPGYPHRAFH